MIRHVTSGYLISMSMMSSCDICRRNSVTHTLIFSSHFTLRSEDRKFLIKQIINNCIIFRINHQLQLEIANQNVHAYFSVNINFINDVYNAHLAEIMKYFTVVPVFRRPTIRFDDNVQKFDMLLL